MLASHGSLKPRCRPLTVSDQDDLRKKEEPASRPVSGLANKAVFSTTFVPDIGAARRMNI